MSIYADIYEFEPFWGVCSAAREQLIIAFVEKIARRKHGVQATEGVRIGTFGRAGGSDETETKEVRVTVVCPGDANTNRRNELVILPVNKK